MLHNMRVLAVGDHFFIISKMSKTSCFKSGHFINIYIINRTLHGRLGIRILSSRAGRISHSSASLAHERYFQHSKRKFVSPGGHVIFTTHFTQGLSILIGSIGSFCFRNFHGFKQMKELKREENLS